MLLLVVCKNATLYSSSRHQRGSVFQQLALLRPDGNISDQNDGTSFVTSQMCLRCRAVHDMLRSSTLGCEQHTHPPLSRDGSETHHLPASSSNGDGRTGDFDDRGQNIGSCDHLSGILGMCFLNKNISKILDYNLTKVKLNTHFIKR